MSDKNNDNPLATIAPMEAIDWSVVPIAVDWSKDLRTLGTVLTTHVWTSPQQQKGKPLYEKLNEALKNFDSTHQRFLPWFTHPRTAVPEIDPPTDTATSWNFSRLDPYVEDFMRINEGNAHWV